MTPAQMNDIVVRFCQGESVTDISAFFALRRSHVEDLLRQAMFSLMKMREVVQPSTTVADVVLADGR